MKLEWLNKMFKTIWFYMVIIMGLTFAQMLMEVPSSNGDWWLFAQHTLGIWLAFCIGVFWECER